METSSAGVVDALPGRVRKAAPPTAGECTGTPGAARWGRRRLAEKGHAFTGGAGMGPLFLVSADEPASCSRARRAGSSHARWGVGR